MKVSYYVINTQDESPVKVSFRPAKKEDLYLTKENNWQSDWTSEFILQDKFEKFVVETIDNKEIIGLGAYQNVPDGLIVYVAYIESAPNSNPTISKTRKYSGIGSVLLAFGIQLSIDYGYDGTIFLQAKTSEILSHYIHDFGAVQYDHSNPFMLLIGGLAAQKLFQKYLLEE